MLSPFFSLLEMVNETDDRNACLKSHGGSLVLVESGGNPLCPNVAMTMLSQRKN